MWKALAKGWHSKYQKYADEVTRLNKVVANLQKQLADPKYHRVVYVHSDPMVPKGVIFLL